MIKIIDNIILLGTSHVSRQSAKEIKEAIEKYSPQVVAIELDYTRLKTLLSTKKGKTKGNTFQMIKAVGVGGYMFAQIAGFVQQKVGQSLNIQPGVDMKQAYTIARDKKIITALIDIDIKHTLKKISKIPTFKKMGMFSSLFVKSFKKEYRNKLNFDVKKGVPDEKFIDTALEILKKEVPLMYQILIEDRNIHMANKLLEIKSKHEGYILAVVGAGHIRGMAEILNNKTPSPNQINFSFNVEVEE